MGENVFAKYLVRILLLVLYPSESSDIRRDVCLVCLVWFVKSQDDVVLWTDIRVRRVCPVAIARNSVHLDKILLFFVFFFGTKSCAALLFFFALVGTMGIKEISGSDGKQSCRASPEGRAPLG